MPNKHGAVIAVPPTVGAEADGHSNDTEPVPVDSDDAVLEEDADDDPEQETDEEVVVGMGSIGGGANGLVLGTVTVDAVIDDKAPFTPHSASPPITEVMAAVTPQSDGAEGAAPRALDEETISLTAPFSARFERCSRPSPRWLF